MTVVLVLAVTLTTLGHNVEKYGPKRCLIGGMTILMMLTIIIAILMLSKVTAGAVYLIMFGIAVGFVSASGWPSCLYVKYN
jgi:hypothetical protein